MGVDQVRFFNQNIAGVDTEVFDVVREEWQRQRDGIELIASENLTSLAVMQAQGSVLTNKYAEGYPHKRYYGGCEAVDKVEELAQQRLCELFGSKFANVQPHSGSQANQAVFYSLLSPGDKILGMALDQGGHLTHGASVNISGKFYDAVTYGVDKETMVIDYDAVEAIAIAEKPKLIIAGASAYPRVIDFKRFREIADKVGAYLMVDMAHISGLVATGLHPSPVEHAHVITSTTHKTLRGPRGGFVLTNDEDLYKKINSTVFPGMQGGPLMHVIAAKAVAFGEALNPEFKKYMETVVACADVMASRLQKLGWNVVSDGTDNHLLLLDLRKQGITGKAAEKALERAGMTCNKNAVPFDEASPFVTSGIRLGTAAMCSRGFKQEEAQQIAQWINEVLTGLQENGEEGNAALESAILKEVKILCSCFPIYAGV